jgi:hypothetical protein
MMTATQSASTIAFIMSDDDAATPTINPSPAGALSRHILLTDYALSQYSKPRKAVLVLAAGCGLL